MRKSLTPFFKFCQRLFVFVPFVLSQVHSNAQSFPAVAGGISYWVNGLGVDLVAPKDTFRNLMGVHVIDEPFTASTGIIAAINNQGTDPSTLGQITIFLAPGYSGIDSNIIQIGRTTTGGYPFMSFTRPIVIKPTSGNNLNLTTAGTFPAGSATVRFLGSQFVTIDGEGSTGQKNLTISLPPAGNTPTYRVVDIIATTTNGCQYIVIKNCNILGNSTTTTVNSFAGIYSGGLTTAPPTAPARRNQFISITGNNIEACRNPIYARGIETTVSNQDLSLLIEENTIGGTIAPGGTLNTTFIGGVSDASGIVLISQTNATIRRNTIRNNISSTGGFRAIGLVTTIANPPSSDSSIFIDGNRMFNLISTVANSGVYGIRMNLTTHTTVRNISIVNNTIGNIFATTGSAARATGLYTCGILLENTTSNAGVSIAHNSINLFGDTLNAGSFSGCIVTGSTFAGGLIVRNNILVNRMGKTRLSTGNAPYAYGYIVNSTTSNPFVSVTSGNNAYYVGNRSGSFSAIGFILNRSYESLSSWRTVVLDSGAVTEIPAFVGVDENTLVLSNGAASRLSAAGRGFGVSTDVLGNIRSINTPSIGAYEFVGNSANAYFGLLGGTTYPINGTNAWPVGPAGTGSFATMADAITYLNVYGVRNSGNAPINLSFIVGYSGETTAIPALVDYLGASFNTRVIFKPAPGTNFTITTAPDYITVNTQYSLITLIASKYVTIDGEGTVGQRNLTFVVSNFVTNGTNKVITVASGEGSRAISNRILNCNIIGSSSTLALNTAFGIYHGHYNPLTAFGSALTDRNDTLIISNNFITAVRTGIYLRGANVSSGQNRQVTIYRNIIGGAIQRGTTDNIDVLGGVANQAGIYLKGIAASTIDSNIIKNTDFASNVSNGFRGIDIDAGGENGLDSAISITRNTIYNLVTTSGQFCIGIRMSLGNGQERLIRIINNNISNIRGVGITGAANISNPSGIAVEASVVALNLGLDIIHNTISLVGNALLAGNASYCVFLNGNVQGGVRLQNNILTNKLGRATPGAGLSYALFSATTNTNLPFLINKAGFINGNAYGSQAPNTNNVLIGTSTANYSFMTLWRTGSTVDASSFAFNTQFIADSSAILDPVFSGPLSQGSLAINSVTTDIAGASRVGSLSTSTGSLVFAATFNPLAGNQTYLINGINNFPGGGNTAPFSFQTINKAIQYLNSNGVDGLSLPAQQIRMVISAGYGGEGDTLITPVIQYPRMNSSRIIVLATSSGRNDTITTPGIFQPYLANSSVFRFFGGSNFIIDGDDGNGGRGITFTLPSIAALASMKLIDLVAAEQPVTNVTIRNCNLIGNSSGISTINTFAGIYMGGTTATPSVPITARNDNNLFENNFIGAVRFGVYMQGVTAGFGQQDRGNIVRRNIVGGSLTTPNTNYFGGVANASGIYLNSQAAALIDSNVIKNNISTFGNNRGIDLAATTGAGSVDSAVTVTRNTIYNIRSDGTGGVYGIAMNLLGDTFTNVTISNNMISGISSVGTASGSVISMANPFGIYIDATGAVRDIGVNIWYNSINLGRGTSLDVTNNAASACLAFGQFIRGGVSVRNNILQNTLGRTSGPGTAASIIIGHTSNIITNSNNNNYFVNAPNAINNIAVLAANTPTPVRYATLASYMSFTAQDTMSINFVSPFINDTNLSIPATQNVLQSWALPIPQVTRDIVGTTRNSVSPTIGAQESIPGLFIDSIAPRIFNITTLPNVCSNGPFSVTFRVFERNTTIASEVLFYSVNGGSEIAINGATSNSGFTRTFVIPGQAANASIGFRYVVTDNSSQSLVTTFPATGLSYISTTFSQFPLTLGFDLPNINGWTVQNQGPDIFTPATTGWNLETFGSGLNPAITPATGIRAALYQPSLTPAGSRSRLVSPCLDFATAKVPSVRIWVSQNGEALTNLDAVNVVITGGFGIWSAPLGTVVRPVAGLAFPRFTQLEVCLANFVGVSGIRVGIEAISRGGSNIVLDSVVIFDDALTQLITPTISTICAYDSMQVTVSTGLNNYAYRLVDAFTYEDFSADFIGAGTPLTIKGVNLNRDTVIALVRYFNINSGCNFVLNDTAKIYSRRFFNGPFITPGIPFGGVFSTTSQNDGAKVGDVLNYSFPPPSGLSNAGYGSTWTIVNTSVLTSTGLPVVGGSTFIVPSGSTNARYNINIANGDVDRTFILRATVRLLPTNCDSVFERRIRVTSAPVAGLSSRDSVCLDDPIFFTNTTTFLPVTGPLTYAWDFGDGTFASTVNANKVYRGVAPGLYTVKMRATNTSGVFAEFTKQIRVLGIPASSYTTTLACGSDSSQFISTTPGTNLTYQWTVRFNNAIVANSTLQNTKFSFSLSDTIYSVTLRATDNLGCRKDTTTNVFSFAKPFASFVTGEHCLGKNVLITNTSTITPGLSGRVNNFGSEWEFGNGEIALSNAPVYKYPVSGTYTIKLKTTSNFGCQDSTIRTIRVFDGPITDFIVGSACQFDVLTLTNTTTFVGGLNRVVFNWNFGDNTANSASVNPVKTYGILGNSIITLIAFDTTNKCYDTTVKVVTISEKPIALFSTVDFACANNEITFNNGSIPPAGDLLTYVWDFGNATTSTAVNPKATYANIGSFAPRLIATTNKGCQDTASSTLLVRASPTPTFTITHPNCSTMRFEIGGAPDSNITYRWNFGDNTTINSNGQPVSNVYQTKGLYTITLQTTDRNTLCSGIVSRIDSTECTISLNELFANKYSLSVYPNPFEDIANIAYNLTKPENVNISVYDALGRKVTAIENYNQGAGNYILKLDERKFTSTSGIYMVRIQIGDDIVTRQLLHK